MKEDIQAGNKLIAEFMELNPAEVIQEKALYDRFTGEWSMKEVPGTIEDLEYHTSWDWQIPVWSKLAQACQKLAGNPKVDHEFYLRAVNKYESAIFQNDPQLGQEIILNLLNWYNETPKPDINKKP